MEWLRSPLASSINSSSSTLPSDNQMTNNKNVCQPWLAIIQGSNPSSTNNNNNPTLTQYISLFMYLSSGTGRVKSQNLKKSSSSASTLLPHDYTKITALLGQRSIERKNPNSDDAIKNEEEQFGLLVRQVKNTERDIELYRTLYNSSVFTTHMDLLRTLKTNSSLLMESSQESNRASSSVNHLENGIHAAYRLDSENIWKVEDILKKELSNSNHQSMNSMLKLRSKITALTNKSVSTETVNANNNDEETMVLLQYMRSKMNASSVPILHHRKVEANSNIAIVQYIVPVPFTIELVYFNHECIESVVPKTSSSSSTEPSDPSTEVKWSVETLTSEADHLGLSGENLRNSRHRLQQLYYQTICDRLHLCTNTDEKLSKIVPPLQRKVAQAALANLLGSVTYFHGSQLLGGPSSLTPQQQQQYPTTVSAPHGLLTGVPSRSFFPRGFLWDEGFHQLVAAQWDPYLSMEVLKSWFTTMNKDGWIAREQILGSESRSRVPEPFQIQRPDIANPPAILFSILSLAVEGLCQSPFASSISINADGEQYPYENPNVQQFCHQHDIRNKECLYGCRNYSSLSSTDSAASSSSSSTLNSNEYQRIQTLSFLAWVYPRLLQHYQWYLNTQAGQRPHSFRWRGASQDHNFASGLDDYPRGLTPHLNDENVDLLAWMAFFANILHDFAILHNDQPNSKKFQEHFILYRQRLVTEHWNDQYNTFCDIGVNNIIMPSPNPGRRTISQPPKYEIGHICHVGYVTILPFVLRLIDIDDERYVRVFETITHDKQLWSNYGLRSLSLSDPDFGTKEDYWRGAVWINMNYLAVSALRYYSDRAVHQGDTKNHELLRETSKELSKRIIDTVSNEYNRTGFLWENYNAKTGYGRGTHPFTGWTGLVTLLISEKFPI